MLYVYTHCSTNHSFTLEKKYIPQKILTSLRKFFWRFDPPAHNAANNKYLVINNFINCEVAAGSHIQKQPPNIQTFC